MRMRSQRDMRSMLPKTAEGGCARSCLVSIDDRVIPQRFAHVWRSPLRFQNWMMMPLRQSPGVFSLIQTQFISTCSHRSIHSPPNFKRSTVILYIPSPLSF